MLKVFMKILFFSTALTLGSCQKGSDVEDTNSSQDSAVFELGELKAVSFFTYSSDSNWPDLKDKAVIDFKICIQDRVYFENIVGEKFNIITDLNSYSASSNSKGCIVWQEAFDFDSRNDETFYKISGTISSNENYKGSRAFYFAVNPWTQKAIDLDHGSAQKTEEITKPLRVRSFENHLKIKDYDVVVTKVLFGESQKSLALKVTTMPQLKHKSIDGTKKLRPLTGGEFKSEFILFQREKNSANRVIISKSEDRSSINEEGQLVSNIDFVITDSLAHHDALELALRVIPIGPTLDIGTDEGFISITSLALPSSGQLNNFPEKLSEIISLAENYKNQKIRDDYFPKHGFIIDEVRGISENEVGANQDSSRSDRHIRNNIELSLIDSLVFQGVNSDFEVELIDVELNETIFSETVATLQRNKSGKLKFTPTFDYDESYSYDFRKFLLRLRGTKAPFENLIVQRILYINPRLRGEKFLVDSEFADKPEADGPNEPEIFLRNFRFKFGVNDASSFKLNKDLDLFYNRQVTLFLEPKVKLAHEFEGSKKPFPSLRTGEYKITLMIMTPKNAMLEEYNSEINLDDFFLLTGDEVTQNSEDGIITASFNLPQLFHERLLLSYKNIAVLKVESTQKSSLLKPGYIIGTVNILEKRGVVTPLVDTRISEEKRVVLAQNNHQIANKFSKLVKEIPYKLEDDALLGNNFSRFLKALKSRVKDKEVPVFGEGKEFVDIKPLKLTYSSSPFLFTLNSNVAIKRDDISEMVVKGDASFENLQKLCGAFYEAPPRAGLGLLTNPLKGVDLSFDSWSGVSVSMNPSKGRAFTSCQKDPASFISLEKLKFVEGIIQQPAGVAKDYPVQAVIESHFSIVEATQSITRKGVRHSQIDGDRVTNYTGMSAHPNLELTRKFLSSPLGFFGSAGLEIGTRTDHYKMSQDTQYIVKDKTFVYKNGQRFVVDSANVKFEALLKSCLLIKAKYARVSTPPRTLHDSFVKLGKTFRHKETKILVTSPKVHLICLGAPRAELVDENWFFVRLSELSDDSGAEYTMARNTVGSIIRGKKAYDEFRDLESGSGERSLFFKDQGNKDVMNRYKNFLKKKGKQLDYKEKLGIGFPGLIE